MFDRIAVATAASSDDAPSDAHWDLGPAQRAASGIADFDALLDAAAAQVPAHRPVDIADVGALAAFFAVLEGYSLADLLNRRVNSLLEIFATRMTTRGVEQADLGI